MSSPGYTTFPLIPLLNSDICNRSFQSIITGENYSSFSAFSCNDEIIADSITNAFLFRRGLKRGIKIVKVSGEPFDPSPSTIYISRTLTTLPESFESRDLRDINAYLGQVWNFSLKRSSLEIGKHKSSESCYLIKGPVGVWAVLIPVLLPRLFPEIFKNHPLTDLEKEIIRSITECSISVVDLCNQYTKEIIPKDKIVEQLIVSMTKGLSEKRITDLRHEISACEDQISETINQLNNLKEIKL